MLGCEQTSNPPPAIEVDSALLDPEASLALEQQLDKTLKNAEDVTAWRKLGKLLHAHALFEEAITAYKFANSIQEDSQTSYLLAVAQAREGDYRNAILELQKVQSYSPALWQQGYWYLDLGELQNAKQLFESSILLNRNDPAAYVGLARTCMQLGKHEDAIEVIVGLQQRGGSHPYITFLLGSAYQRAGQAQRAAPLLQVKVNGPPAWDDPWFNSMKELERGYAASLNRSQRMIDKGNLQGALQELQKLKLKNPQDAAVSNNLATVQLELGDFNRAKDILSKSMRWSPNYAPSYFTMGVVFMREKAFERAGEYLQKAIELQPSMTNAYSVLGKLSLQQGKLQEARNYFEQAIKIGSNDLSTRETLGMVLLDLDEFQLAGKQFSMVLNSEPNRTLSIGGMAVAMASIGNVDEAITFLTRAKITFQNDASIDRALNVVIQMKDNQ